MNEFNEDLLEKLFKDNGWVRDSSSSFYGWHSSLGCLAMRRVSGDKSAWEVLEIAQKHMTIDRMNFLIPDKEDFGVNAVFLFWDWETVSIPYVPKEPEPIPHGTEIIDKRVTESGIEIWRTGQIYSFAGNEFAFILPNTTDVMYVWSPPWNDLNDEEQYQGAIEHAELQLLGVIKPDGQQ